MSPGSVVPMKSVLVVERDPERGRLLVRYLEARGWKVEIVADARRVIRRWAHVSPAPAIVLAIEESDPDAYELLGAIAAHAVDARVVVCAPRDLDLRGVPVGRVLPIFARLSSIASALDELTETVFAKAAE